MVAVIRALSCSLVSGHKKEILAKTENLKTTPYNSLKLRVIWVSVC